MKVARPIWLASRSPRRRQMLEDAGIELRVMPADIDDASLRTSGLVTPAQWVMALAYLKARRVADTLRERPNSQTAKQADRTPGEPGLGTVLGADTVCVAPNGEILGQPRDAEDARRMLRMLRNASHQTITGVCLIALAGGPTGPLTRRMFADAAAVRIGDVSDRQIEDYIARGDWCGKAGAYNLSERIEAGWPIECAPGSDPATVMGLPMRRLVRVLSAEC